MGFDVEMERPTPIYIDQEDNYVLSDQEKILIDKFRKIEDNDRYIVIADITIDAIIANIGILKTHFSFKESPNNTLTTCNKITTASIPHNIPRGIPIIPI